MKISADERRTAYEFFATVGLELDLSKPHDRALVHHLLQGYHQSAAPQPHIEQALASSLKLQEYVRVTRHFRERGITKQQWSNLRWLLLRILWDILADHQSITDDRISRNPLLAAALDELSQVIRRIHEHQFETQWIRNPLVTDASAEERLFTRASLLMGMITMLGAAKVYHSLDPRLLVLREEHLPPGMVSHPTFFQPPFLLNSMNKNGSLVVLDRHGRLVTAVIAREKKAEIEEWEESIRIVSFQHAYYAPAVTTTDEEKEACIFAHHWANSYEDKGLFPARSVYDPFKKTIELSSVCFLEKCPERPLEFPPCVTSLGATRYALVASSHTATLFTSQLAEISVYSAAASVLALLMVTQYAWCSQRPEFLRNQSYSSGVLSIFASIMFIAYLLETTYENKTFVPVFSERTPFRYLSIFLYSWPLFIAMCMWLYSLKKTKNLVSPLVSRCLFRPPNPQELKPLQEEYDRAQRQMEEALRFDVPQTAASTALIPSSPELRRR